MEEGFQIRRVDGVMPLHPGLGDVRVTAQAQSGLPGTLGRRAQYVLWKKILPAQPGGHALDGFAPTACQGAMEVVDGIAAPIRFSVAQDQQLAGRTHFESGGERTTIPLYMRVSPDP
jgi:hypothetical protein